MADTEEPLPVTPEDLLARLQSSLMRAVEGFLDERGDREYVALRRLLLANTKFAPLCPPVVRLNYTSADVRRYLQDKGGYKERRNHIKEALHPLHERLEAQHLAAPSDAAAVDAIANFGDDQLQAQWDKALSRRQTDPEGAITMARTLLETTCKHVLHERRIDYDDNIELPKLYRQVRDELNLAPDQHTEAVFKQILGGCTSIVEGLGALRNKLSDSHGTKRPTRPAPRHAELAVNLAGAMASFILATHAAQLAAAG